MDWHRYCGYALLGARDLPHLLGILRQLHRALQPVRARSARRRELSQGSVGRVPGHNPLGALSVLALLGLLLTQIVLGLFAVDVDGIESGPLSTYVSFETGRVAAQWHEELFDALLWLIGLHVAAVLFYLLFKKENLVGTMFHGMRTFPSAQVTPVRTASWVRFTVGVVLAGVLTWMVTTR